MASAGKPCIKYTLFAFNLLFVISGLVILVAAILSQNGIRTRFGGDAFHSDATLGIIVGCIIFVIAFFGCCGAIRENRCMLITFSVFLVIILVIELVVGFLAYQIHGVAQTKIPERMNETLHRYGGVNQTDITEEWDSVQNMDKCCGIHNASDWRNTTYYKTNRKLPASCCPTEIAETFCDIGDRVHPIGCLTGVLTELEWASAILCGVGIGIAIVQFIGIVFACCLARALRNGYEL